MGSGSNSIHGVLRLQQEQPGFVLNVRVLQVNYIEFPYNVPPLDGKLCQLWVRVGRNIVYKGRLPPPATSRNCALD